MTFTTKHVTFTIPKSVVKKIEKYDNKSRFVTEAIEEKIEKEKIKKSISWINSFRKKYANCSEKEILKSLKKDRSSH